MEKETSMEIRACELCEDTNYLIVDFRKSRYLPAVIIACFGMVIFLISFQIIYLPLPKLLWFPVIVCASLTLILFFCIYLPNGIIGNYLFYFKDQNNKLHCHKKLPTWVKTVNKYFWENPPENIEKSNAKNFQVFGPIVQVNFGGWFKKSDVYPNPRPKGHTLNEKFRVLPNKKQCFNLHTRNPYKSIIYQIEIETIMKLIENFSGIDSIIYAAIRNAECQKAAKQKLAANG